MKFLKLLIIIAVLPGLTSCNKKGNPKPKTGNAEVIVKDGASGNTVSGATVNIFQSTIAINSNTPEYSAISDQSGIAIFTITDLNPATTTQLYIIAQKGSQKSYYDGLIPVGIFTSFTDIQNSPVQSPPGQVGGVKFLDLNHDGQINNADDTFPPFSIFGPTGITVNSITIF